MKARSLAATLLAACAAPTQTRAPVAATPAAPPPAVQAAAVDSAHGPDAAPMPLWPEIKKGRLPNGLTYYILKHGKPEKRAIFWLAVNAGSVQEDDDQRGLAHFDEHMAFNGTQHFPKSAIVDYLESIGMRFGADINAYTNFDQTVYQLEVPTDRPGFVDKGLDILRDWAGAVSYDPVEVGKERGVVKEEWRLGRGAQQRLRDRQDRVLFAGTRYVERDTIGLPEVIDHAARDKLVRFYQDWYRPELMAVIAVGDFDVPTVEREIHARFGDLTAAAPARVRPTGGMPRADGTRVSIESDPEIPGTVVTVANLVPHRGTSSLRDYRRQLLEAVYAGILDERFRELARKPGAPFIFANGGVGSPVRDVDGLNRIAAVKGDKVEDALRVLLTETARIEKHGVSAAELDRVRAELARTYSEAAETEATQDSRQFADEITRNFFTSELIIGIAAEKQLALQILPTITVAELDALMKPFQGGDNRVVLISGPNPKVLPTEARVRAIIDEVAHTDTPPWEERAVATRLMATPPEPGKIVAETRVDAIGVAEWTLSNGVRVIVKPTDYELDAVSVRGSSPGGLATVSDRDFFNARYATQVADRGGVGDLDAEALTKVLTGKRVSVSTAIGQVTEGVEARASAHDLPSMMQLLYLRMTAPRKDPEAFSVWQQNFDEQIANLMRVPEMRFMVDAQDTIWKGNPRRRMPAAGDANKVDLDRALALYRDRFGDASDFTFVIVGAVKLDELRPLVETYLASLPAHHRLEKERDLKIRRAGGVVVKSWQLGQDPKATVDIEFHGERPWTRDADRDVSVLGMILSIQLREVLREDLGGVYGVHAGGDFIRSPHAEHVFDVRFGCDPQRVDELVKAAFGVMDKLVSEGPSTTVLEKVRTTFTRSRETEQRKNAYWTRWLSTAYRFGDDPTIVTDPQPVLARMTPERVKAAARRYLDRKQYFELVMRPEKTAAPPATESGH